MNIAAFDIGGTALKMGIATTQGELLHTGKAAINDSDGDAILSAILSWVGAIRRPRASPSARRATLIPTPAL